MWHCFRVHHNKVFAFLALSLLLGLSNPGHADTIWFTNDGGDQQWSNPLNWKIEMGGGNHSNGLPDATLPTYITSSDHTHMGSTLSPEPAILDGGFQAETRNFYVGGWDSSLDADHGNPDHHSGVLEIRSGQLVSGTRPDGIPPCYYIRVGHRGSRGAVQQTGGSVSTCTYISFAYKSPDGTGIWRMDGGYLEAFGLDLGVMGLGILDMSGGHLRFYSEGAGRTNVGRGYFNAEDRYAPGVGLVNQTGGFVDQHQIRIADGIGSAGTYTIRKPGSLVAAHRLVVGHAGNGAWVQMGGNAVFDRVDVATLEGSTGTFTLSGGGFAQTDPARWFRNGPSDGGAGNLVVIGTAGAMQVERYLQNSKSRLTVVLDAPAPHVTPIVVETVARFLPGAVVDVEFVPSVAPGSTPVFAASPGQLFELLAVSGGGVDDQGLALASEDQADWQLEVSAAAVSVRYCPTGAPPPCI